MCVTQYVLASAQIGISKFININQPFINAKENISLMVNENFTKLLQEAHRSHRSPETTVQINKHI